MSYDISIERPGEVLQVESFQEGGTYAINGSTEADLNVTYNYSKLFPFGSLKGKTINEAIPILAEQVANLGVIPTEDYWEPTPGNVGHAALILLRWCLVALEQQYEGGYRWFICVDGEGLPETLLSDNGSNLADNDDVNKSREGDQ